MAECAPVGGGAAAASTPAMVSSVFYIIHVQVTGGFFNHFS
jgi:hypothetical protein